MTAVKYIVKCCFKDGHRKSRTVFYTSEAAFTFMRIQRENPNMYYMRLEETTIVTVTLDVWEKP